MRPCSPCAVATGPTLTLASLPPRRDFKEPITDAGVEATNSRAVPERAKQLVGWEDTADLWAALEADVKDAVDVWKAKQA